MENGRPAPHPRKVYCASSALKINIGEVSLSFGLQEGIHGTDIIYVGFFIIGNQS